VTLAGHHGRMSVMSWGGGRRRRCLYARPSIGESRVTVQQRNPECSSVIVEWVEGLLVPFDEVSHRLVDVLCDEGSRIPMRSVEPRRQRARRTVRTKMRGKSQRPLNDSLPPPLRARSRCGAAQRTQRNLVHREVAHRRVRSSRRSGTRGLPPCRSTRPRSRRSTVRCACRRVVALFASCQALSAPEHIAPFLHPYAGGCPELVVLRLDAIAVVDEVTSLVRPGFPWTDANHQRTWW